MSSLKQRVRPGCVLPGYLSGVALQELQRDAAHLLPDHEELRVDPRSYSDVLCTGVHTVRGPFARERLDALVSSPELVQLAASILDAQQVHLQDVYLRAEYVGLAPTYHAVCTADVSDGVSLVLDVADGTLRITAGRTVPPARASEPQVRASVVLRFVPV